jgi:serine/threonine-protein kinase
VLSSDAVQGWYLPGGVGVFARSDGGVFASPFDVDKLVWRDGSTPVPVLEMVRTGNLVPDIVVSQGGTLVYRLGGAQQRRFEPVFVTRDGATSPVDSGWAIPLPRWVGGIAVSPDGRRLALAIRNADGADIWIKTLGERGAPTRMTFEKDNGRPAWTADGRTVLFVSGNGPSMMSESELRSRRADGTGGTQTLLAAKSVFADDRAFVDVAVTKDTSVFVLRTTKKSSRDIVSWRKGEGTVTPLVANDRIQEVTPAISPDGRWLAYVSDESGRNEVYVRPFPHTDAGWWQVSRSGGTEPTWAHSGRELFYRDRAGALVAAAVTTGNTFALGDQKVLFSAIRFHADTSGRSFAVMPDDRRFVFYRDGPEGSASTLELIRVTNWLSEVRSLMKAKGAK